MVIDRRFWECRKIFLTGHTGFKGSWLSLWLHSLGARVTGFGLPPPTDPSLFRLCQIDQLVTSVLADVRNGKLLAEAMLEAQPEVIIHMAAQSLVREAYKDPVETYSTNVMGTVNLFEAVRKCESVRAVVNVTTDKCYENREWVWGYRENEPMGGYDPYSNSKACSELVTSSYRSSFFNPADYDNHGVAIATARSGNVIGGGDWATDRLIPDCIRAILARGKIVIRNPEAVRPWQHVLEPLSGYLLLAERLYEKGPRYAEAWNFGPNDQDAKDVEWIVRRMCSKWGQDASYVIDEGKHPHEAQYLKLDCSKAKSELGWHPHWTSDQAISKVIEWLKAYSHGEDVRRVCLHQIKEYESMVNELHR